MSQWINYTPEFQRMIVLLSSPVAQLVALWGMTTQSTLQLMTLKDEEEELAISRN
jgi:hypothetical protein